MILEKTFQLNSGEKMPVFGAGTWQIKNQQVTQVVLDALELGYRLIDTAALYKNEQGVGQALRESGIPRGELFLTTKLRAEKKGFQTTLDEFEASMQRLKTEYLDLYLIHAPWPWNDQGGDYMEENIETWKAMEKLQRTGVIRSIGVSNFDTHQLEELMSATEIVPAVNQIEVHIGYDQCETVNYCKQKGIVVQAYSPLGTGDTLKLPIVQQMAEKYGVSAPQLALQYLLQKNLTVIPRSSNQEHLAANANLHFQINQEDLSKLESYQLQYA